MIINKHTGTYNLSARPSAPLYIVVHYVGSGTSRAGSAKANCQYFGTADRQSSADFFIDDGGIWQYNPNVSRYYTWAVGDGKGRFGITNANSISIEVCINNDKAFTAAEVGYLRELVVHLMKTYGIPAARVVMHYDASRKACPYYYSQRSAEWLKLRNYITTEEDDFMAALTEAQQKALYNEVMDKSDPTGRNKQGTASYKIKWMAKKQEDMQKQIDDANAKLDLILDYLKVDTKIGGTK